MNSQKSVTILWLVIGPALLFSEMRRWKQILLIKNPVVRDWFVKPSAGVPWLYLVLHPNTSPTIYSVDTDEPCVIVLNILLGQDSKYAKNILYSAVVVSSGKCFSARKRRGSNVFSFSSRLVAVSFIHHVGTGLDLFLWQSRSKQLVVTGGCNSQAAGFSGQVRLLCCWNCCTWCEVPHSWSRTEAAP